MMILGIIGDIELLFGAIGDLLFAGSALVVGAIISAFIWKFFIYFFW